MKVLNEKMEKIVTKYQIKNRKERLMILNSLK